MQALWNNNSLSNPIFGFGLRQLDSTDVPDATSVVSGGYLTLGDVNSTLFTGKMNFIPLSNSGTYWNIPLSNVAVQGTALNVNSSAAVIDTFVLLPTFAQTRSNLVSQGDQLARPSCRRRCVRLRRDPEVASNPPERWPLCVPLLDLR